MQLHVDASCVTVKADAARRAFNAYGDRIVWAVVDSGIDGRPPALRRPPARSTTTRSRDLHRVFPPTADADPDGALVDESGHGTHVAGIIAGAIDAVADRRGRDGGRAVDREPVQRRRTRASRCGCRATVDDPALLAGMAPRARLVSLKVLRRRRHARGPGEPGDPRRWRTSARSTARAPTACASTASTSASATSSTRSGSPAAAARCARRSTSWCAPGWSWWSRRATPATARSTRSWTAPTKFGLGMTINDPGNAERPSPSARPTATRRTPTASRTSRRRARPATGGASPTWSRRASGSPPAPPGARLAAVVAGEAARRDRRLRRGQRHQHGRAARVRGGRRVPVGAARVHRPPGRGQADLRRVARRRSAAGRTSRAAACST